MTAKHIDSVMIAIVLSSQSPILFLLFIWRLRLSV